jgi:hypothetical protein
MTGLLQVQFSDLQQYAIDFRKNSYVVAFFMGNIQEDDEDIAYFINTFYSKFWLNNEM